jgi:hypothetical protein
VSAVPTEPPAAAASAAPPTPSFLGTGQQNDTASLLRELSSLGLDDEPAQAAPPPRAPSRPTPPADKPKKKKGLFGR